MDEFKIKNNLEEIAKLTEEKNKITQQIKQLQKEIEDIGNVALDEAGTDELRNTNFTLTRIFKEKKTLNFKEFLDNSDNFVFFCNYAKETGNVKVGAEKTFEKKALAQGLQYDNYCKIEKTSEICVKLRPDVEVEEKMSI